MSRTRFFTTVAAVLALHVAVQAQDLTVTGTVTDGSSGEPVPFASIQVKGTLTGGSADTDGHYSILVEENAVLVFSSIGYVDTEVEVAGRSVIDVSLEPDTETLMETTILAL